MKDGIWIELPTGEQEFVYFEDLDPEILSQVVKPVGGFCFPAGSFMFLPLAKTPFYVAGWIPQQGKAMIYGMPKSGKSYLAMQLARCVGVGEAFLGIDVTAGTTLYLQFELGSATLQERMKSTGQEYPNVFVGSTFDMRLDSKTRVRGKKVKDRLLELQALSSDGGELNGQEKIEFAIAVIKPDLVICDPIQRMMGGDPNELKDWWEILSFQDKMIEFYDNSFLNLHHAGKDFTQGPRGSSLLMDWHDSVIAMKRLSPRGEPLRIRLEPQLLRHAELPPEPIEAELANFEFQLAGKEQTIFQKVWDFAKGHGDFAPRDLLAAGIGSETSRSPIHSALERLVRLGEIEKVERGKYKSVKEGELSQS